VRNYVEFMCCSDGSAHSKWRIFITADILEVVLLQFELIILEICDFMAFISMPLVTIKGYLKK